MLYEKLKQQLFSLSVLISYLLKSSSDLPRSHNMSKAKEGIEVLQTSSVLQSVSLYF